MTRITVYDVEAERIERLCEKYDLTEAELIELVLDNIDEYEEDAVFGR